MDSKDPFIVDIFYFISASLFFFNTTLDLKIYEVIILVILETLILRYFIANIIKTIFSNYAEKELNIFKDKLKEDIFNELKYDIDKTILKNKINKVLH